MDGAVTRFGYIRETNYGQCFEVRTLTVADHLAYTSRALEPHSDNPYRNPVPTLQLLQYRRQAGDGGATFSSTGWPWRGTSRPRTALASWASPAIRFRSPIGQRGARSTKPTRR